MVSISIFICAISDIITLDCLVILDHFFVAFASIICNVGFDFDFIPRSFRILFIMASSKLGISKELSVIMRRMVSTSMPYG